MKLPAPVDYQQAISIPSIAFLDEALRRSNPRITPLGMPAIASGGFALTFDLTVDRRRYAVRCFHRRGNHLQERYAEISKFVRAASLDFLVEVDYLADGIRVGEGVFPIVRMPWVIGERLNTWIDDHLYEPRAIDQVRLSIAAAVSTLRQHDAAHGDIQHGNILVQADQSIRLIDYDGIYLSALRQYGAAEHGHRNYQHPQRTSQYDKSLDLFAALVVDLSLAAVISEPQLWKEFNSGENLLFSAEDFAAPGSSAVFRRLQGIPELTEQATRLQRACEAEFGAVQAVLTGAGYVPSAPRVTVATAPAPDTIRATDRVALLKRQGDEVTVVGKIVETNSVRRVAAITFLNFGDYRQGHFTVVAFDRGTRDLIQTFGAPARLKGSWVMVTGILTAYHRSGSAAITPQIELTRARSLKRLSASEAAKLLKHYAPTQRPSPSARVPRAQAPRSTTALSSLRVGTPSPNVPHTRAGPTWTDLDSRGAALLITQIQCPHVEHPAAAQGIRRGPALGGGIPRPRTADVTTPVDAFICAADSSRTTHKPVDHCATRQPAKKAHGPRNRCHTVSNVAGTDRDRSRVNRTGSRAPVKRYRSHLRMARADHWFAMDDGGVLVMIYASLGAVSHCGCSPAEHGVAMTTTREIEYGSADAILATAAEDLATAGAEQRVQRVQEEERLGLKCGELWVRWAVPTSA